MKPLNVEVIAYAPTAFFHCQACELVWQQVGVCKNAHTEQIDSALPADVMDDYKQLSDWIISLVTRHGTQLAVRVIDAASLEGFWRSLRYGVRRYPAVVIDRVEKLSPADFSVASAAVERHLAQRAPVR